MSEEKEIEEVEEGEPEEGGAKLTLVRGVSLAEASTEDGRHVLLTTHSGFNSEYEMIGWLKELWPTYESIVERVPDRRTPP